MLAIVNLISGSFRITHVQTRRPTKMGPFLSALENTLAGLFVADFSKQVTGTYYSTQILARL